ncbi:unnamed protein product [Chrysoparadoxa australica]
MAMLFCYDYFVEREDAEEARRVLVRMIASPSATHQCIQAITSSAAFSLRNASLKLPLVGEVAGKGCGLFASDTGALRGEQIMRVPPETWSGFSCDKAVASTPLLIRQRLSKMTEAMPHHVGQRLMATSCLSLELVAQAEADPMSYAGMLQQRSRLAPHPLLMGEADLAHLQASPAAAAIRKRQSFYRRVASGALGSDATDLADSFIWGMSTILSRASNVEGHPMAIAPYFDLMNHSASPNCTQGFDVECSCFTVVADQDLEPHEELSIDYGAAKGAYQFLLTYGFIDFTSVAAAAASDVISLDAGGPEPLHLPLSFGLTQQLDGASQPPPGAQLLQRAGLARALRQKQASYGSTLTEDLNTMAHIQKSESVDVPESGGNEMSGTSCSERSEEEGKEAESFGSGWKLQCLRLRVAEKQALAAALAWADAG